MGNRKTSSFKLVASSLPYDIQSTIRASEAHFQKKLDLIDEKLSQILPHEIADKLKVSELFDSTLCKKLKRIFLIH